MVLKAITDAFKTAQETVRGVNEEAQRAAATTAAFDTAVTRVVNTAQEEADKIGKAASEFMDGLKALIPQEEQVAQGSAQPSAPALAAQIKKERVDMFAGNPSGPASGRGATDWRDRFSNRGGHQQEPDAAPTASSAP